MKCGSRIFSERKLISSHEIKEGFLEEVISECGLKVEAGFGCVKYIPAEGAVLVDSLRRGLWGCVQVVQGLWAGIRQEQLQVSCWSASERGWQAVKAFKCWVKASGFYLVGMWRLGVWIQKI